MEPLHNPDFFCGHELIKRIVSILLAWTCRLMSQQIDFESILWLDKTENSYTNWAPSEPSRECSPSQSFISIVKGRGSATNPNHRLHRRSTRPDPDEICIAINPRTGLWHDVMCTEANVPACERGEFKLSRALSHFS